MSQSEREERKRFLTGRDLDYIEKISVGHPSPYVSDNKRAESSYRSQLRAKIKGDLVPYYREHLDDWNIIAQALTFDEDMDRGLRPYLQYWISSDVFPLADVLKSWLTDDGLHLLLYSILMERRKKHSGQRFFSPVMVLTTFNAYLGSLNFGELDPDLEVKRKEVYRLLNEIIEPLSNTRVTVESEWKGPRPVDVVFPIQKVVGPETAWLLDPEGLTLKREENALTVMPESGGKVSFSWGYEVNLPALVFETLTILRSRAEGGWTLSPRKDASVSGVLRYLAEEIAFKPLTLFERPGPAPPDEDVMKVLREDPWGYHNIDPGTLRKIIKGGDALVPFEVDTEQWYMATRHLREKVYENIWTLKLSTDAQEALKSYPFITLEAEAAKVLGIFYPFNTMDWLKRSLDAQSGGLVSDIKAALNEMEERGLVKIDNKRWWRDKPAIHVTEEGLHLWSKVAGKGRIAINTYWNQERIAISSSSPLTSGRD